MLSLEMQPTASFYSIDKSSQGMGPFFRFYSTLHGLTERDFFKFMSILMFTESTIYQIDEENELGLNTEVSQHWTVLLEVLKKKNLYDEQIAREIEQGKKIYDLERLMCGGKPFTEEQVLEASTYKSFDVRVLHRLMFKLMDKPYDEGLLGLFRLVEILIDLEDDLEDYADDTARNAYNTYRMFVKLHGVKGKAKMEEYMGSITQQIRTMVAGLPRKFQKQFAKLEKGYRAEAPIPKMPEPIIEKA